MRNKGMRETNRTSSEAPLEEVIQRLLKVYKLDGKMKEMEIINAWPEMMGVAIANRTKEIYIKNGILFLTLDSSVIRDELAHGKQIITMRINEKAGTELIRDVWFK